ncbi:MAG: class I SAM-dependent methyltransferase [Patescibacteria group bacterium]|jgi:SAM-dependent methyltransferase
MSATHSSRYTIAFRFVSKYNGKMTTMTTKGYYSQVRSDLFPFIAQGKHKILDVGCGEGKTLAELKKLGKAWYTAGIDICPEAVARAKKVLDKALVGDIENISLPWAKDYFDYIILADVLEHLTDPWTTVHQLKKNLKNDGFLIVSVPNIRNITILKNLIFDKDWTYRDRGILDKTHLRFFTLKTIQALLKNEGFSILEVRENLPQLNKPKRFLNQLVGGRLKPWYVVQYLIKARKAN